MNMYRAYLEVLYLLKLTKKCLRTSVSPGFKFEDSVCIVCLAYRQMFTNLCKSRAYTQHFTAYVGLSSPWILFTLLFFRPQSINFSFRHDVTRQEVWFGRRLSNLLQIYRRNVTICQKAMNLLINFLHTQLILWYYVSCNCNSRALELYTGSRLGWNFVWIVLSMLRDIVVGWHLCNDNTMQW